MVDCVVTGMVATHPRTGPSLSWTHGPFGKTWYGRVLSVGPGIKFGAGVQTNWPSRAAAASFLNSGRGGLSPGGLPLLRERAVRLEARGGTLPGAGEIG